MNLASLLSAVVAAVTFVTSPAVAAAPASAARAFYSAALRGSRVTPVAGRKVRPVTEFVMPTSWRLASNDASRLVVVAANKRSGCRITVDFRSSVSVGPAGDPLELARTLLPVRSPVKLYEEATRAQTDHPAGAAAASRMTFDYSHLVERAVRVTRLGTAAGGKQTWLVLGVVSKPTSACNRDNALALIHHPADMSTVLAGARTRMDR